MSSDAQRSQEHAAHRLGTLDRLSGWLRLATAVLVVVLIGMVAYLGYRLDDNESTLQRQDCIARTDAAFFGHLADALSKEPASTQRQEFLDLMKSDARSLKHLDQSCPQ